MVTFLGICWTSYLQFTEEGRFFQVFTDFKKSVVAPLDLVDGSIDQR